MPNELSRAARIGTAHIEADAVQRKLLEAATNCKLDPPIRGFYLGNVGYLLEQISQILQCEPGEVRIDLHIANMRRVWANLLDGPSGS